MDSSTFFNEITSSVAADSTGAEIESPFAKQRLRFLLWYTEHRSDLETCSYTTEELARLGIDETKLERLRTERRVLSISIHNQQRYPCGQFIKHPSFQPAPELAEILTMISEDNFVCYLWLLSNQVELEGVPLEMIQDGQAPIVLSFLRGHQTRGSLSSL